LDLNGTNIDALFFFTKIDSWWASHPHLITWKLKMVTKEIFADIVEVEKTSYISATQALIMKELTDHFLASTLMDDLGFCYHSTSCQKESSTKSNPETTFPIHLSIVKVQYIVDSEIKYSSGVVKVVLTLLSTQAALDIYAAGLQSLFKVIM